MRVPLSATREGWHCHSLRLEPRRHVLQARDVVELDMRLRILAISRVDSR